MTEGQALAATLAFSAIVALATGSKVALAGWLGGLAGVLLYMWGGGLFGK